MTKGQFISDDYKPGVKPFDNIDEIISKLTDKEKAALLAGKDFWHSYPIPEYNIPAIRTSDGPNGVRGTRFFDGIKAACFPCGTALGSTWDKELLERAGQIMGLEAKAKGAHAILGPTLNIQRSPLGGRGFESFSEDPVLSGLSAGAITKGIQSEGVQATLKHFVCNDQEHERNSMNVVITERALREGYLLPFQLAIRDGKPGAIMCAYNKVNGTHVSQNSKLLKDLLRDEWKWDGLVMSDWFGVYSVAESVRNGLDLEMPGPPAWRGQLLEAALANKAGVTHRDVDERVKSVLKFVQKAFEESGIPEDAPEITRDTPETRSLLREIAADSIVVLKNENILPLSKEKSTAVIGPNGKITTYCGGGSASLRPYYTVSPYDGIASKTKETPAYTLGVNTFKELPLIGSDLIDPRGNPGYLLKAYDLPRDNKNRKLLDTRYMVDTKILMPDYNPNDDALLPFYFDFEAYLIPESDGPYSFGVTVSGIGKLYIDDELVVDNETHQTKGTSFFNCGTIEEVNTIELKAGQKYKINFYYGSAATSKLEQDAGPTFGGGIRLGYIKKTSVEDEISKAVEIAQSVDQVILTLGLNSDWESEGYDRDNMDYPPYVDTLVREIKKVNSNVVVVNQSGTPVTLNFVDEVPAIVQAWYGGNETGNAIADVLFGDVNPSGKLSLTYPERLEDNPALFNFRAENGRTLYGEDVYVGYKYYEVTKRKPLYPFGHGLSYSTFEYNNLTSKIEGENVIINVDVTNTGKYDGKEVVQVYISQKNPSIRRPLKELRDFTKVFIEAGKTEKVEVSIPLKYATSFWHEIRDEWISEKDTYVVSVGQSSENILVTSEFETEKTFYWRGI